MYIYKGIYSQDYKIAIKNSLSEAGLFPLLTFGCFAHKLFENKL